MQRHRMRTTICATCMVCVLFLAFQAQAIGTWLGGTLMEKPWQENGYFHVLIDEVRYTVMEEATVHIITSKNGMTLKELAAVEQLRKGDVVTVQHSGNRIYAIEINR